MLFCFFSKVPPYSAIYPFVQKSKFTVMPGAWPCVNFAVILFWGFEVCCYFIPMYPCCLPPQTSSACTPNIFGCIYIYNIYKKNPCFFLKSSIVRNSLVIQWLELHRVKGMGSIPSSHPGQGQVLPAGEPTIVCPHRVPIDHTAPLQVTWWECVVGPHRVSPVWGHFSITGRHKQPT